jgi:hypothetical protein
MQAAVREGERCGRHLQCAGAPGAL